MSGAEIPPANPPAAAEPPFRWPPPAAPWDGHAVASVLVLLTCVLAPASVWLGISGVRRTAGGVRRGRGCAVAGVVGGVACTLLLVAGVLLGGTLRDSLDPTGDLAIGDCVDQLQNDEDDSLRFSARSCSSPHDAEVAYLGELTSAQVSVFSEQSAAELCTPTYDDQYRRAVRSGRFAVSLVVLGDPEDPAPGDRYLCLLMRNDFGPLRDAIGADR